MSSLERLQVLLAGWDPAQPADLERWSRALQEVSPPELPALDTPGQGWNSRAVCGGPHWQLSLFGLAAGARIPLHDHPGMHVLTRVLRGRLRVEPWEVLEAGPPLRARELPHRVLRPGDAPQAITPRLNLHALEALEHCVFLDLFCPDYAPPERDCTYYQPEPGEDGSAILTAT